MFRGKESSNRIELSRLVQELLNFGVSGSLWLRGVGLVDGSGGGWMGMGIVRGCPPHMYTCMHAHACTCMRGKHDNFMQMATPIGFGEIPGIPYDVICACACMCMHVCMCMCTCVGGILSPPHTPIHPPPPPPGGPPESVKIL